MRKSGHAERATGILLAVILTFLCGCGPKEDNMNDARPRELPEDFTYEVEKSEHTVSYTDSEGREIVLYGELWSPKGEGRFPAVVMSHGFNGHYRDFTAECRRFAARGYICYAFDLCGAQSGGKSTGRTAEDYTIFTMKEDLRAALSDVRGLESVDESQIFLFGGSQGGLLTALTAADEDIRDTLAGIAMYFPAFNIPDDWRTAPVRDTPLMGYSISARYISAIRDLDPFEVIGGYEGDVCIVWGDRDALVARRCIDGAVEAYGAERVDLTVIPGAGHGFGGAALTTAIERVLAFLEAHTFESA